MSELSERLRALHVAGDPLVLVNAWDVASAREVEAAGATAIATASAAIAASLGLRDDNSSDPETVFGIVGRIAGSTELPVTADIEGGYGLDGAALVEQLLASGAVGCNVEDSDHGRPGELVDAAVHARRLAGIREAAGTDVVLNARIDVLFHQSDADPASLLDEVLARARLYVEAGADCVYPILLSTPALVERLVGELGTPVNANLGPSTTVKDLADAGASRISVGPMGQRQAMAALSRYAKELLG